LRLNCRKWSKHGQTKGDKSSQTQTGFCNHYRQLYIWASKAISLKSVSATLKTPGKIIFIYLSYDNPLMKRILDYYYYYKHN